MDVNHQVLLSCSSLTTLIDSSDRCQTGTSGTVLQWWILKKEIKVLNDDAGC